MIVVSPQGETESKEEQGWILPEEKEPTKQESGFTEVHSEPVSREPTRDVSLTTDDEVRTTTAPSFCRARSSCLLLLLLLLPRVCDV
jgi:hypothetical protein